MNKKNDKYLAIYGGIFHFFNVNVFQRGHMLHCFAVTKVQKIANARSWFFLKLERKNSKLTLQMEEEQPLKRAKREIKMDTNADVEDLIEMVKNRIEESFGEASVRILSVPKPLAVFDTQLLQIFFIQSCEVSDLVIAVNE